MRGIACLHRLERLTPSGLLCGVSDRFPEMGGMPVNSIRRALTCHSDVLVGTSSMKPACCTTRRQSGATHKGDKGTRKKKNAVHNCHCHPRTSHTPLLSM
jgi:hypothetical protein